MLGSKIGWLWVCGLRGNERARASLSSFQDTNQIFYYFFSVSCWYSVESKEITIYRWVYTYNLWKTDREAEQKCEILTVLYVQQVLKSNTLFSASALIASSYAVYVATDTHIYIYIYNLSTWFVYFKGSEMWHGMYLPSSIFIMIWKYPRTMSTKSILMTTDLVESLVKSDSSINSILSIKQCSNSIPVSNQI